MTASKFADSTLTLPAPSGSALGRLPWEFIRYFGCSALALALDAGLFGLGLYVGLAYSVAAAIGFIAGLVLAYFLSVRFVFRDRRLADERTEFVVFACVGVGGLVLTELLLWLLIGQSHWHPAIAKLVAAGIVFGFNFGARKVLLFTKPAASQ